MNQNLNAAITNHDRYLLGIPAVSSVLIWFWVGGMNLMQSPGSSLLLLGVLTICLTAALAANEVSKTIDLSPDVRSPTTWFCMIAFLWIVAYPMYMYQRRNRGLPNRVLPACLLVIVFCGSWGVMNSSIEERKAGVRQSIEEMRSKFSHPSR